MSREDEAVRKLDQTGNEMREVLYEIQIEEGRKKDLTAALNNVDGSVLPNEVERLRYLIGQCQLKIDTANCRRIYLEKRGSQELEEIKREQQLRPWLKPKKPTM